MDTSFFREIKPYNRGGNNIKNTKGTYYLTIEFTYKTTSFKMANIKHNKLIHGVYLGRISPFINLFLYTNPGFFEPFSNIIINLGHPMGVVPANGIPSARLHRRVINKRVIFIISEKRQKACKGRRCVIIYELGHWQEVLLIKHLVINKGKEVNL